MSAVALVVARILEREGSIFTNDPLDAGGPTKWGLTLPFLASLVGRPVTVPELQLMTDADATRLYTTWMQANRLDDITDVAVLDTVADFCVHHGLRPGIKALQRALDVPQDGALGPVTLGALADAHAGTVVKWVNAERIRRIGMRLASEPSQAKYARGWLNRVADVLEAT